MLTVQGLRVGLAIHTPGFQCKSRCLMLMLELERLGFETYNRTLQERLLRSSYTSGKQHDI
jgi:hypothetical protein